MSPVASRGWRDFAVCLSLANLCYLDVWHRLQRLEAPGLDYFRRFPLSDALLVTACSVLLLGLALWMGMHLVRRSGNPSLLKAAQCAFFLVLIIPMSFVETSLESASMSAHRIPALGVAIGLAVVTTVILTGPVFVLVRGTPIVLRVARTIVLLLTPLFPLLVIHSAWFTLRSPSATAFEHKPLALSLPDRPFTAPRVVWLVFDELDERLAFASRPRTIGLPEFDRFRRQAIHAVEAHSPARWTLTSMPALISGRLIAQAEPRGVDDLSLTLKDDSERVRWSEQPNVFAGARTAGLNTAVVGWYHPYCRILYSSLTQCSWQPYVSPMEWLPRDEAGAKLALGRSVWGQLQGKLSTALPVAPFGTAEARHRREGDREKEQHSAAYLEVRDRALEAVTNPHLGLILVHWPIPHASWPHERAADPAKADQFDEYIENLALSDRTLGELRAAMEGAGLWERTIVLVSADHGLRNEEAWSHATREAAIPAGKRPLPLVPFLVKLAGQNQPLEYVPPFNTVLTHDLLLALLRGDLSSQEEVLRWLDRNRARFPAG